MAPKQRMRIANEKASKYVTMRGNVPKSSVSTLIFNYLLISFIHNIFLKISIYFHLQQKSLTC